MNDAPHLRAPRRWRRALPWAALLALLAVAQTLLVALTVRVEAARAQDAADAVAAAMAGDLRRELLGASRQLQALAIGNPPLADWRAAAGTLVQQRPELRRVELRNAAGVLQAVVETPYTPRLFDHLPRESLALEAELSCQAARRAAAPLFSRSYYVPLGAGAGQEVMDLCLPVLDGRHELGFLVGSFALPALLEAVLATRDPAPGPPQRYEISFVEGDGTRLARAGVARGAGVFVAERLVDLPGSTLQLRADSTAGQPSVIPNLATALVLGLSLALFAVVLLLARDVRRRAVAERALAEALAFRKAMEDSLSTGLRARDLQGVITYVNPAFCAMVGFSAAELLARPAAGSFTSPYAPPYWPPERVEDYRERQQRLFTPPFVPAAAGTPGVAGMPPAPGPETREGHETLFMRKTGERFPVMVYEAPLVDGAGRHTGWMSAVVDISAQRRVEELSRQQQDRLQAAARLATVGEMASLMSHELNQPLAAIASYAAGTLNLLDAPPGLGLPAAEERSLLRQAVARIAEQAERAGRIIKSVHGFVRRREQQHETLGVDLLIEAVLPLVRLQARKSGTRIEIDIGPVPTPLQSDSTGPAAGRTPRVRCDRTMIEQVLLNLTRNGIQAMETATPPEQRVLTLRVRQTHARWVGFSVVDAGPGITVDVAARLFTPFFTTREEGMGLGLSLCRTVIEQHGGVLDFGPGPPGAHPRGTEFRFTLPTPRPAAAAAEGAELRDTAGAADDHPRITA